MNQSKTQHNDRWDLIALRIWGIPELGWSIAAVNPALSEYLILPAEMPINVPDISTIRRPLKAANPARDGGDFLPLPSNT